jgi:hypothetical protein
MVNADWVLLLTKTQDLLLQLTDTVYTWVEEFYEAEGEEAIIFRDNLNMSAFIIDNTIVEAITIALMIATTLRPSSIQLNSAGAVVMEGEGIKEISLKVDEMNSPTPALEYGLAIAEMAMLGAKFVTSTTNNINAAKGIKESAKERTEKEAKAFKYAEAI